MFGVFSDKRKSKLGGVREWPHALHRKKDSRLFPEINIGANLLSGADFHKRDRGDIEMHLGKVVTVQVVDINHQSTLVCSILER